MTAWPEPTHFPVREFDEKPLVLAQLCPKARERINVIRVNRPKKIAGPAEAHGFAEDWGLAEDWGFAQKYSACVSDRKSKLKLNPFSMLMPGSLGRVKWRIGPNLGAK